MKFSEPLIQGRFLKRYKRFFADVEIDGKVVVAHVANTGSMKGVVVPGQPCLCSQSKDPNRKLKFSLEAIQGVGTQGSESHVGGWIGVNTASPNKLVAELLQARTLPHWQHLHSIRGEYAITKETRFDFAACSKKSVKEGEYDYFIEVKNVTYLNGTEAQFPDSVTERGQKHLRELIRLTEEGKHCEIVFVIQRTDCEHFAAAKAIDPEYARLLDEAKKKGVLVTPLVFEVKPEGIHFLRSIIY